MTLIQKHFSFMKVYFFNCQVTILDAISSFKLIKYDIKFKFSEQKKPFIYLLKQIFGIINF